MKRLMIVAGEVSGDQHAARLVRDLRAVRGDVDVFGPADVNLVPALVQIFNCNNVILIRRVLQTFENVVG